jgi:hypothetical protein
MRAARFAWIDTYGNIPSTIAVYHKCNNTMCVNPLHLRITNDSFWPKVQRGLHDDCWIWQGYIMPNGYGRLHYNGKDILSHRCSWEIHYGPIPQGMFICHTCDNPPCVNPKHLFLGTDQDNMDDMYAKDRASVGSRHPNAKLTETQVSEIIDLYSTGEYSQSALARRFNVGQQAIQAIVSGKTWKHLHKRSTFLRKGDTKLSKEHGIEIRKLCQTTNLLQKDIGEMFGVSQSLVGMIKRRVIWKDI